MSDPAWIEDLAASLPQLLTLAQTAELLRIHERTVHRMLRDGRLRSIRHAPLPGARHLIPRAELMRYLSTLAQ
jgi:excisionase family DNA binding protein